MPGNKRGDGQGITANIAPLMFLKIYGAGQLASERQKRLLRQNGEVYPITET